MSRIIYILLYSVILFVPLCEAQTIALPDSLFRVDGAEIENDELPALIAPHFSLDNPLFEVAPAVTVEDYLTAPDMSYSFFAYLPDLPSEFFLHVLLLHLSKVKIMGLDAELARYELMLDNFNRNLYKGGGYKVPYVPAIVSDVTSVAQSFVGGGSGVVVSGCLDPLEAYRRWVQERRLLRAKAIIHTLEDVSLPPKDVNSTPDINISLNIWQMNDDDYDVKVKQDGDNPPYRP